MAHGGTSCGVGKSSGYTQTSMGHAVDTKLLTTTSKRNLHGQLARSFKSKLAMTCCEHRITNTAAIVARSRADM